MLKKSTLSFGLIVALTSVLIGCGGGSGSSNSDKNIHTDTNQPVSDNKGIDNDSGSDEDTTNIGNKDTKEKKEIASATLLANDTELPPMPDNINPIHELKDKMTIDALKKGIYTYDLANIVLIGDKESNCGGELCPMVTKFYYNENTKEIEKKSVVYLSSTKEWRAAQNIVSFVRFPEITSSMGDENQLFGDYFVDYEKPMNLSEDSLEYKFGNVEMVLSGQQVSLANKNYESSLTNEAAVYSKSAKSYQFYGKITKGGLVALTQVLDVGLDASKLTSYSTLADFRDAHRSQDNPFCFDGDVLVFSKTGLGVTEYYGDGMGGCDASIKSDEYIEAVKNNTIYLGNKTSNNYKGETSSLQYYKIIDLDGAGHGVSGKVFQPGYAFVDDVMYYNEVAIQDWIKTKYTDEEALEFSDLLYLN